MDPQTDKNVSGSTYLPRLTQIIHPDVSGHQGPTGQPSRIVTNYSSHITCVMFLLEKGFSNHFYLTSQPALSGFLFALFPCSRGEHFLHIQVFTSNIVTSFSCTFIFLAQFQMNPDLMGMSFCFPLSNLPQKKNLSSHALEFHKRGMINAERQIHGTKALIEYLLFILVRTELQKTQDEI